MLYDYYMRNRPLNAANLAYDACLIQHLGFVQNNLAATQIAAACRQLNPPVLY